MRDWGCWFDWRRWKCVEDTFIVTHFGLQPPGANVCCILQLSIVATHLHFLMSCPSTSTLYAGQQHLLREHSLQSLSPSTASLHLALARHSPIEVDHFSNCPNIYCTIAIPHTYYHDVVEACPQHIPTLYLRCFHPNLEPFPNNK